MGESLTVELSQPMDPRRPKKIIDRDIIGLPIIFECAEMRYGDIKGDTEIIYTGTTESEKEMGLKNIAMMISTARTAPRGCCRQPRAGTAKRRFNESQMTNHPIERRGDASRKSQGLPPTRYHRCGQTQSGPGRASATMNGCSLTAMNNLHILELDTIPIAVVLTPAGVTRLRANSIITMSAFVRRYISTHVIRLQKEALKLAETIVGMRSITITCISADIPRSAMNNITIMLTFIAPTRRITSIVTIYASRLLSTIVINLLRQVEKETIIHAHRRGNITVINLSMEVECKRVVSRFQFCNGAMEIISLPNDVRENLIFKIEWHPHVLIRL